MPAAQRTEDVPDFEVTAEPNAIALKIGKGPKTKSGPPIEAIVAAALPPANVTAAPVKANSGIPHFWKIFFLFVIAAVAYLGANS